MEHSPKNAAGSQDQTDGNASGPPSGQQPGRVPFRAVGLPMRLPAPSSPLQEIPPGRRVEHIARASFINRNFALLWWGQAISSVGDFAWDTALVLWVATYLVAGQSWAPLAVSGLVLAAAIPQIVVGPIALSP